MASILPGFEYDIFISYRHNDNRSGWVTEFVSALKEEIASTIKDPLSIYFDINPHDGLLETHHVDKSLEGKLRCLVFIPIISQTYCDPRCFAWEQEFRAFNKLATDDQFGRDIKLSNGNVASRILPVKIHDLDADDKELLEKELGGVLRAIEFIYKEAGVNLPLKADDRQEKNLNGTKYRNQVNKVANAIKELTLGLKNFGDKSRVSLFERVAQPNNEVQQSAVTSFWQEFKRRNIIKVATVYAIAGWAIIQIASTIFPPLNIPGWALSFLIVLVLLGFPIALILAWAFEVRPDGSIGSVSSSDESSGTKAFYKAVIAFLLIVIIGSFFYFQFHRSSINDLTDDSNAGILKKEKSIAVLPFENLSNDIELENFCEGITEEILNHLSKVRLLSVTSRTSVKMYKGTKLSVKEIAQKLGVTHILEGSVRKSGKHVRITAQLIDASTDKHLWSEDYDYRELKDIFPVQTDVSTRVTEVLKIKLTQQEKESLSKKYTDNIQAYQLYRRGRNFWDLRTKQSYDSAEVCYKRAIEIDPDYALAYSGLADCYTYNAKGLTQVDAIPLAKAYAEKALSLDSTLCEALTTIGFIQSHFDYNWEAGKKTLQKALLLDPNYETAHRYLGNILTFTKNKDGYLETKRALDLDPLSASVNWVMGRHYYTTRQFDLSISQLQRNINLNPNFSLTLTTLVLAYIKTKKYTEALNAINKMPEEIFGNIEYKGLYLSYLNAVMGKPEIAEKQLANAIEKFPTASDYRIAQVYLALGHRDKALERLEKAYSLREITLIFLNVDPDFDAIQNEPRFKALLKKMNFD